MVYEHSEAEERYLFSNDLVIDGLRSDFDDILEQPKTFTLWMTPNQHAVKQRQFLFRLRAGLFGMTFTREITRGFTCQSGRSRRS